MSPSKRLRALSYGRVSTPQQAKKYGLDAQDRDTAKRIKVRDYEPCYAIRDAGISGTTGDREGLQKVLDLVRRKAVDVVVVPDARRLARDVGVFIEIEKATREAGVRIECSGLPMTVLSDDEDEREEEERRQFLEMLQDVLDGAKELRITRRRCLNAQLLRAEAGYRMSGRANYGLLPDPKERGAQVEDPRTVGHVLAMFAWLKRGGTLGGLQRDFNGRGILSPTGKRWSLQALSNILSNPVYTGRGWSRRIKQPKGGAKSIRPPDRWIPFTKTPRLVSDEDFQLVQARLADNKFRRAGRPGDPAYILRHLLRCAHCDYAITAHTVRKRGRARVRRYEHRPETTCPYTWRTLSAEVVEAAVWREVTDAMTDAVRLAARLEEFERSQVVDDLEVETAVAYAQAEEAKAEKAVQHLVGLVADPDTGYLFREQLRDAKRHWDQMRGTRQAAEARAVPLPWAAPGVLREHAGLVATLVKGSDLRTDPVRCGKILQALLARVVVQFEPQGLKLFGPLFSQASPPSLAQVCVPSLFPQQCLGQMEHIGDSHQGLQYAIPLAPGRRERL